MAGKIDASNDFHADKSCEAIIKICGHWMVNLFG